MKLYAVSYGYHWEGNYLDSIWDSKERAEARQRWLKEEYSPDNYDHWLDEYELNVIRKAE
jgi:hypothetical protein